MTTTKTLGICPRCKCDEYQEFERDEGHKIVWAFLAGFLVANALVAGAILMLMSAS